MTIKCRMSFVAVCALLWGASLGAGAQHTKQAIENDINELYSANGEARAQAADRLVAMGSTAISPLVRVICDKSKPSFARIWPVAAKALGNLKAAAATPCLLELLGRKYPPIGPMSMKSDDTIAGVDPAFAALLQIGPSAVEDISYEIQSLDPQTAYLALRVLRSIKTPSAKEAVDKYIDALNGQIRLANTILEMWDK